MSLENLALAKTDDFPIKHQGKVHNGKVRSCYWMTNRDSIRLTQERNYPVVLGSQLGVMIISDRISAFDVIWQAEQGLNGVPYKGASLNTISKYWFDRFDKEGFAENHILESPHPLVWIVQRAEPIMVEAIARQYITGSMWRAYEKGERNFCGISLPSGLQKNQRLSELLITPSTKGIMSGIPEVPEEDDVNITRQQIFDNYQAFGFKTEADVDLYEARLKQGCRLAEGKLNSVGQIFVDTKFEFGYIQTENGPIMIYIDEVITPDSSRIWDKMEYKKGRIVENSKEGHRKFLLKRSGIDPDILLDKLRFGERKKTAESYRVPVDEFMKVSETYKNIAETITGQPVPKIENARQEILDSLSSYGLVA